MSNSPTSWYCDVCRELIDSPKDGYVIWKNDAQMRHYDFKIIHQEECDRGNHTSSCAIEDFLGEDGLARLLSHLSLGPIMKHRGEPPVCRALDTDEFVDLIRRVQTPFYEEARQHFRNGDLRNDLSDANEVAPYLQETLKKIAEDYEGL